VRAAYPEDLEVVKIIEICHLYPQEDWRHWTDYQGYHLTLTQDQRVLINRNYVLSSDQTIITDLYHKAPVSKLSQESFWAFIVFGEGNESQEEIIYLWLLGRDQRLRLACFDHGDWLEPQPPLSCGIQTLRVLVKNFDVTNFREVLNHQLQGPVPAQVLKAWATIWPLKNDFKLELLANNKRLADQLLQLSG
jgi:hypothetical protein